MAASMFLSLCKKLKRKCGDGVETSPQSSVNVQEQHVVLDTSAPPVPTAVSTSAEAQTLQLRKSSWWRWWKKSKQTPPTEDVAENADSGKSISRSTCDDGDAGVQQTTPTPDRPAHLPPEPLLTDDVAADTSLPHGDAAGTDVATTTHSSVSAPSKGVVLSVENGADDAPPTDSPVPSKLVHVVPRGSRLEGADEKPRRLSKKEQARLGFPNLDETCYMNAVLQALLTLRTFVEEVHSQQPVWTSHSGSAVFWSFVEVEGSRLSSYNENERMDTLVEFKDIVARSNPEFVDDEQKDAHEFLSSVFSEVTSLTPSLDAAARRQGLVYTCPVRAHIGFQMSNIKTCMGCGEKSVKQENFLNLSLKLVPGASVSQCLQEHLRESRLERRCDCGAADSSETYSFSTLPDVLIIQLQRFGYGVSRSIWNCYSSSLTTIKDSSRVILPAELLVPECGATEQARYSLVSVISHLGRSAESGHYICDGVYRCPDDGNAADHWLTFDDDEVRETTVTFVCRKRRRTAYLLFYHKSPGCCQPHHLAG